MSLLATIGFYTLPTARTVGPTGKFFVLGLLTCPSGSPTADRLAAGTMKAWNYSVMSYDELLIFFACFYILLLLYDS